MMNINHELQNIVIDIPLQLLSIVMNIDNELQNIVIDVYVN